MDLTAKTGFAPAPGLMRLDEALRAIGERAATVVGIEAVPLAEADGRVLAADLAAPRDLPGFDNAAVDGYALRFADLARAGGGVLPLAGRVAAGHPVAGHLASGRSDGPHAVRIFTGAPLPAGFDTVAAQEDVVVADGAARFPAGLAAGANRRRAGEDIGQGAVAVQAGRRLGPADLALVAALGCATAEVRRRLRVAIASTGDELTEAGSPLRRSGLYDANRPMLVAMLRRLGCAVTDLGILPDRREAVAAALSAAAGAHDLVVTSGGVSVGEEDHVKAAVAALGRLDLWRLAIKPGRPLALGRVGDTPFVGLPGNPVAAFVTFAFVARHLVARLRGETYREPIAVAVPAGFEHAKRPGLREFVRVGLERDPAGRAILAKHPRQGAGMITSLSGSEGLAVLPEDVTRVAPGDPVGYVPFTAFG